MLSKCTHRITADDEFDSQRWNKDSCQSLIMSVCVCVSVLFKLTFRSHMVGCIDFDRSVLIFNGACANTSA